MEEQERAPAWWPYPGEFPDWRVWRGVDGLCYAQLAGTSPPVTVRGEDAVDLRDQVIRAQLSLPPANG